MTFEIGDKVTSKWSSGGAVWEVAEQVFVMDSPSVRGKVLTKYRLKNVARNLSREEYDENLRVASKADLERALGTGAPVKLAASRVSEFVRQWKISYADADLIYEVHFDASTDKSASLLISDLERLLK